MLRSLVSMSLKYKFVVAVLAAALIVVGVGKLQAAPVDVLPEFSPPYVEIQTEALGLSAEEVDQLVTLGLEQDLLNGVPWLQSIYSESVPGLSSITLVFEPGTDLVRARQMVAERLAQAFALPHVSKPPTMLQPLSSTSRVMVVGLSSKTLTPIQMSVLARWTISPRLLGVPGVANVAIWGQRDRQLQVLADPKRLAEKKVSLLQVLETTGNALWVSSLSFVEASTPGTGGFIDTSNQRIGIRHLLPIVSPEGLAQVPIEGTKLVLGDVATITEDHQPLIGDALTQDGTGLLLVIEKFPGANPLEVSRGIQEALDELAPGMTGLDMNPGVFRPVDFIQAALANLGLALLLGLLFVTLLLAALWFEWRTVLIGLITIPVSFFAAALVLYAAKATFNIVVVTGFLAAIGIVVDDAVADVTHIATRLREARARGETRPAFGIILEASLEIRSAMLYALLVLVLVIAPIFFLGQAAGSFYEPLAIAYGLALAASMLTALTLTPALFLLLYSNPKASVRGISPVAAFLERLYTTTVLPMIARTNIALILVVVLTVAAVIAAPFLRVSLMPSFKERNIIVHLEGAPGMSQPEMSRIAGRMSNELRTTLGIQSVSAQVGRAIYGDRVVNVNSAELWVSMDPAADYESTLAEIRSVAGGYPGIHGSVQTYLQQQSNSASQAGSGKSLVVRVYGDADAGLRVSAEGIQKVIAGIPGVENARVDYPVYEPTLEIEVNLAAAKHYGVKPGDVRRAAATMFSGIQVGSLFEEQKVFDVVVWGTPESRQSISNVLDLQVDTPSGGHVRLGDVAQVRLKPAPSVVRHEAVHRYMDVLVTVQGASAASVASDIRTNLRGIQLPLEYHAEVLGETAAQQASMQRVVFIALAALLGIFLLLQAFYKSWRLAFIAMLTSPSGLSGGVLAILLTGGVISLGSLAGLLLILGAVIRNGIAMTNFFYDMEDHTGAEHSADLVMRGATERLVPVLASTLAAAIAFLPALFIGDAPGLETIRPMAVVVLGGAITTLILDLLVLPALYFRYGFRREPDLELASAPSAAD
ncbi:MAG: efflux RND transporter permease subunit [Anaerolineae bacterium]